ncbi:hypothetical protein MAR_011567 [Mya arenaria]|uniref:Uncharacterized protein n=1 Tax=Mya arenaria TaxID=6604 RepID=A0ABY7FUF9_MYAAR|nr:hypothetical protein MAR_011567 [Mya arenaria]
MYSSSCITQIFVQLCSRLGLSSKRVHVQPLLSVQIRSVVYRYSQSVLSIDYSYKADFVDQISESSKIFTIPELMISLL